MNALNEVLKTALRTDETANDDVRRPRPRPDVLAWVMTVPLPFPDGTA